MRGDLHTGATPIIVTGCFLSGASIVSGALRARGIVMVASQHAAGHNDLAGSGCDREIVGFHRGLLETRGISWLDSSGAARLRMSEAEKARARSLVDARAGTQRWGWSDPFTAFFWQDWSELLPNARWVFVLRPAATAVWAMARATAPWSSLPAVWAMLWRGWLNDVAATPIRRARAMMNTWAVVGGHMLDIAERQPESCRLIELPAQLAAHDLAHFLELVDLELMPSFVPRQFRTRCPRWIDALARFHTPARQVTRRLAQRHTRTSQPVQSVDSPPPRTRICLVSQVRFTYSQTFVRDHLTRLPADTAWLVLSETPENGDDGLPLLNVAERAAAALLYAFGCDQRFIFDRAIRRYLRRHGAQAVLAEFGMNAAALSRVCRSTGIPLIAHFHGFDVHHGAVIKRHLAAYRELFHMAAAYVVVSEEMKETLVELGAQREKIVCIPCGVDTRLFADADPASAPPVFLSVGRFVDKKAPLLTLLAFRRVLREAPEARLVMAGDGTLWFAAQLSAEALGISGQVSFPGPLTHAGVAAHMRNARAFVQHSLRTCDGDCEGTPVGILEAAASGLPVVSTRHTGIRQAVIDGVTGFLVDERDVDSMATAMIRLARDPELAGRLGRSARDHVRRNYEMSSNIERLWKVIEQATHQS